jgi:hypothetical protein
MGKPSDETATPELPAIELPKAEGVFNLTLIDGTKVQALYNPVTGHWLTPDKTQQLGVANRIASDSGEKFITAIEPIVATAAAVEAPAAAADEAPAASS